MDEFWYGKYLFKKNQNENNYICDKLPNISVHECTLNHWKACILSMHLSSGFGNTPQKALKDLKHNIISIADIFTGLAELLEP